MSTPDFKSLAASAKAIRKRFLQMHFEAQSGHIGTGLSSIELLTYLHGKWLGSDDFFILSKGHGASALYATLNHFGKIPDPALQTYYKDGTRLPAHPAPRAWPAIPAATGSLGHGLSIASGIAYAKKHIQSQSSKTGTESKVVCLLSDGECNEGSTWEAIFFAAHHGLDNLTVVIDANGLQGFGRTSEVINLEPFLDKWKTFGFDAIEIQGHDFQQIDAAFSASATNPSPTGKPRPRCILARTIKGKGVSYMENRLEWHYLPMKEDQFKQAIQEVEAS